MRPGVGGARGAHARWRAAAAGRGDRPAVARRGAARRPRRDGRDGPRRPGRGPRGAVRAGRRRDPREPAGPASPSPRSRSSRSGSTPSWRPGAARPSACTASARAAGRRAHRRGLHAARTGASRLRAGVRAPPRWARWRGSRRSPTTAPPSCSAWGTPRATARRSSWRPGSGPRRDPAGGRSRSSCGVAAAATAWSGGGAAAALFPDGLQALGFAREGRRGVHPLRGALRGPEAGLPGTDRAGRSLSPGHAARRLCVLARRSVLNGWHRELQAAVGRAAPRARRRRRARRFAQLVPDRALAARLPRTLTREPVCDEAAPGAPTSATVAATEERERPPRAVVARVATRGRPGGG